MILGRVRSRCQATSWLSCRGRYDGWVKRNAQATKQRIFEAATAEFSQHGIAGARIDRIAAASGSNKSMIYVYYGCKDGLFDAVGTQWISRSMNEVPVDAHDLPEYAARLFDQCQEFPEMLRIVNWTQLERGPTAMSPESVAAFCESKIRAIEQAQQAGLVSDRFSAATLLELILALIQTRPSCTEDQGDPEEPSRRRQAIKDAVERLVQTE
jgi:AcrR family transcriptional regulator